MRKTNFLIVLSALFIAFGCSKKEVESPKLELWYKSPAKIWEESLPLGNGRLGAMPTGGVYSENIVLNDITMWSEVLIAYNKTWTLENIYLK